MYNAIAQFLSTRIEGSIDTVGVRIIQISVATVYVVMLAGFVAALWCNRRTIGRRLFKAVVALFGEEVDTAPRLHSYTVRK